MTVVQRVKSEFNPTQWGTVVLPMAAMVIGSWMSLSNDLGLTKQLQTEYLMPTVAESTRRISSLEAINSRREEQISNLQRQNEELIAEIRQLGAEIRQYRRSAR